MEARILIVHDDPVFTEQTAPFLRSAGYEVLEFRDPLAAYNALATIEPVAVLITRVRFPAGRSNGISLAMMARIRQPGIPIIFAGSEEHRDHTKGLGTFLPLPVAPETVVATVKTLVS